MFDQAPVPQQQGQQAQPGQPGQSQGLDWQTFLKWLMAKAALNKAAGIQQPAAPQQPTTPDPYADLRKAIATNPNNQPQPSPDDLKLLSTPKKKKK